MKILMTSMIMLIFNSMIFLVTMLILNKTKMSREKNSPFECGFSNLSTARKPLSINFFLIATLFLIFDIQISVIIPMSNTKMVKMNEWLLSSSLSIMILILNLIHEWKNGMLEWAK